MPSGEKQIPSGDKAVRIDCVFLILSPHLKRVRSLPTSGNSSMASFPECVVPSAFT